MSLRATSLDVLTVAIRRPPFPRPSRVIPLPPPAVLRRMRPDERKRRKRQARDFRANVAGWMLESGFAAIRALDLARGVRPSEYGLATWIAEAARTDGKRWIVSYYDDPHPRPFRIADEDIDDLALVEARIALSEYDPGIYLRAEHGGRKSKRGPTFTVDHLDALAIDGFEGSITETAALLGCSEATVSRRRAERDAAREGRQGTG